MRHISEPIGSIELIDLAPSEYSPLISKCTVKVCYVDDTPNRNRSVITKEVARDMAPSLRGAIIAGYFNEEKDDFEDHARVFEGIDKDGNFKFSSKVRPYGFVDVGARVWFQNFMDDGEHIRTYLCTEGWLWTSAYPEAKKVIDEGRGQSMELDRDSLKGSWSNDNNRNYEFFIISEAVVEKLTILGEDVEPCFEGASATGNVHFSLDDEFKDRVFSMLAELKELLLEEGGETPMKQENENPAVVEEEEILPSDYKKKDEEEEEKKDSQQEEEKTSEEEAEDKDSEEEPEEEEDKKKKKDYALEYAELLEQYNTLQSDYSALQTEKSNLESELTELREFKATKDREEKQDMIDSFSMLEEEDKKDVQDNIDNYTVEQIEEKLSVICVRKKVNFAADENENEATTYNLNSDEAQNEEPEVPAWIKAVQAVVAENN